MNITLERKDDLNATLKVNVTEADYQEKVMEKLKDQRKHANIPGFRKGKVPMSMVKELVGERVILDEINSLIAPAINNYLKDNKIDVIGQPLPFYEEDKKLNLLKDTNFEFSYRVGLVTEIDLKLNKMKSFTSHKLVLSPKDVDEYMADNILKRYGKMTNPAQATEDDMLYGKLEELEGNTLKENGIVNSNLIVIKSVTKRRLRKSLCAAQPNDVFDLDITTISEHAHDQAAAIGVKEEDLSTINTSFRFTVEKINKLIPAELNQDLFDKIFGKDVVKSEEAFRTKIKESVEQQSIQDTNKKLEQNIYEKLLSVLKIKISKEFLTEWIKATNEKPITIEEIEKSYGQYEHSAQMQLLQNKIAKQYNVNVTNEDMVSYVKQQLMVQMTNMGMPVGPDEQLLETVYKVMEDENERNRIYGALIGEKLFGILKENLTIKEKEVSYKDFVKSMSA